MSKNNKKETEQCTLHSVIESALPCPFCGGTNLAFISDVDGGSRDVEFIVCMADDCLADGRIGKNKEDALNKWNKRHSL
jgi:Lar family restriction alleviation protein